MSGPAPAASAVSFDLCLVGLNDPSPAARARLAVALSRLHIDTSPAEHSPRSAMSRVGPLIDALDRAGAETVVSILQEAGGRVDLRPRLGLPSRPRPHLEAPRRCPGCGATCLLGETDCFACSYSFTAAERTRARRVEAARRQHQADALLSRRRADTAMRAQAFLSSRQLPPSATAAFARELTSLERPFLHLETPAGPVLFTSVRVLARRDGELLSLPWELVADIDVHRSRPWPAPARLGLRLTLAAPVRVDGELRTVLSWEVAEAVRHHQHVLLKWAFTHRFTCVWCGDEAIEARRDGEELRGRCQRCACDHFIDPAFGRLLLLV